MMFDAIDIAVRDSDIEDLQAENAKLKAELALAQKDAERLDFIMKKALESRTGVTIDYCRYVEDGYVIERGFRISWYHKLNARFNTLREAIDAELDKEAGK